jgi:ferredoxin
LGQDGAAACFCVRARSHSHIHAAAATFLFLEMGPNLILYGMGMEKCIICRLCEIICPSFALKFILGNKIKKRKGAYLKWREIPTFFGPIAAAAYTWGLMGPISGAGSRRRLGLPPDVAATPEKNSPNF